MDLNFISELNESSQYRTIHSLKNTTTRNIADHCFMDLISLWILYNEYEYAPAAIEYARKTTMFGNFNTYRQSATDLYLTAHILSTENLSLTTNTENDKIFFERINVSGNNIFQFVKKISRNTLNATYLRHFLLETENSLKIENSNYRSVRRMAQNWGLLTESQKSLVITRIVQFYDANAKKSELYNLILDLSKEKSYIIQNASNAETKSSYLNTASKIATLGVEKK
jgi:hypothetical protein